MFRRKTMVWFFVFYLCVRFQQRTPGDPRQPIWSWLELSPSRSLTSSHTGRKIPAWEHRYTHYHTLPQSEHTPVLLLSYSSQFRCSCACVYACVYWFRVWEIKWFWLRMLCPSWVRISTLWRSWPPGHCLREWTRFTLSSTCLTKTLRYTGVFASLSQHASHWDVSSSLNLVSTLIKKTVFQPGLSLE